MSESQSLWMRRKEREMRLGLEHDAGAGKSDYSRSLTFTSDKFIVIAFGHDRDHCEDVLQCVLRGKLADAKGDKEHNLYEDDCKVEKQCEQASCQHGGCLCGHAECGHANENVLPNCSDCDCSGFEEVF